MTYGPLSHSTGRARKRATGHSGGHLSHHIHELDLIQVATMVGGNVAHGPQCGDREDLLLITLGFPGNRYALLEYASAFHWPEHHVFIQGTRGAVRIDLQDAGVELRTPERVERFLLHRTAEEDADRTRTYRDSPTDGASRTAIRTAGRRSGSRASSRRRWCTSTTSRGAAPPPRSSGA